MFPFFNTKSVFSGTDYKAFNEMREYLKQNGVKYKYKVNGQTGSWEGGGRSGGIQGSVGTRLEDDSTYEILINKKDAKRLGL